MNRLSVVALFSALAVATGCGGPAPEVHRQQIPGVGAAGPARLRVRRAGRTDGRSSTPPPARWSAASRSEAAARHPRAQRRPALAGRACPARRSPGPASTSRSCRPAIARPTALAWSTSARWTSSRVLQERPGSRILRALARREVALRLERGDRRDVGGRRGERRSPRARRRSARSPKGSRVRPDGQVVYVTCEGTAASSRSTRSPYKVLGADDRRRAAARRRSSRRDGARAFVTSENAGTVSVIDAQAHNLIATITLPRPAGAPLPPRPMGLVLSPDGRTLYVTFGRAKSISVIDVATQPGDAVLDDIGARPWGIGISADGKRLYTANGPPATSPSSTRRPAKSSARSPPAAGPGGFRSPIGFVACSFAGSQLPQLRKLGSCEAETAELPNCRSWKRLTASSIWRRLDVDDRVGDLRVLLHQPILDHVRRRVRFGEARVGWNQTCRSRNT